MVACSLKFGAISPTFKSVANKRVLENTANKIQTNLSVFIMGFTFRIKYLCMLLYYTLFDLVTGTRIKQR
ncbi:hypothetical protein NBRC116592_35930 [Colwellia sp. KU-HH00111]